jgi:curved DNA-binding protein CbpA
VPPPPGIDRDALDRAVKAWFRRLALAHHPDRGGDTKVMQALNEAHQQLLEFLNDLKR